jgi:plasmid stabilization system protein ParE
VAEVVWRARAVRHLSELYQYLHERSLSAAAAYASGLYEACLALAEFPEKAPRYNERYRALKFRNHLIFYSYGSARDRTWNG